jgi:large subunit ribosomal protein L30
MARKLRIRLKRGLAGKRRDHYLTVRSLGLRKRLSEVILPDTPEVWGRIRKVAYLLEVTPIEEEPHDHPS